MRIVVEGGARGKARSPLPWIERRATRLLLGERGVLSGLDADERRAVLAAMTELVLERDRARQRPSRSTRDDDEAEAEGTP